MRTEALWVKCESCRTIVFRKDLEANAFRLPEVPIPFQDEREAAAGNAAGFALDGT